MPGVQIDDLYQIASLSQPCPSSTATFFVKNTLNQQTDDYQADIYRIDDQGQVQQFTNGGLNLDPVIANQVLYFRSRDSAENFQIMAMPIDGGVAQQLTTGPNVDQLLLSSDQQAIFYKSSLTNEPTNQLASRHVQKIQNRADGRGWLPTEPTFTLHRLELKNLESTTLWTTHQDFHLKDVSKNRQQILYLAANHPDWTDKFDTSQGVYLYDLNRDEKMLLTATIPEGVFTDARFAPDGQEIALIGSDYHAYSATTNQLFLYNIGKKELQAVNQSQDLDLGYQHSLASDTVQQRHGQGGAWLDQNHYLFHAYHHGRSQLYLWDRKTYRLVADQAREIIDFAVQSTDTIILITSTPSQPAELKTLSLTNSQEKSLYNPNQEYEKSHQYAHVTSFHYTTSDQNAQIQGWFTEAQNVNDSAPLILYIHGGPHAAYGDTFFHEFQALAENGFHVLYLNPRGSTSYGEKFATAVMGHYGEEDYDDVLTGLDYALDHFSGINQEKIFVAGGSYGGFLSAWAISHTDRFQAAIVQRPAIDWISLYTNSDIGVPFVRAELGADLYQDPGAPKLYWEKSPLAHANKVKTPVRIQHGELDCRCPVSQSEALFLAIKATGTDCDYIRYPQSYHGLSRTGIPSLRIKRLVDIVDWFNYYAHN